MTTAIISHPDIGNITVVATWVQAEGGIVFGRRGRDIGIISARPEEPEYWDFESATDEDGNDLEISDLPRDWERQMTEACRED